MRPARAAVGVLCLVLGLTLIALRCAPRPETTFARSLLVLHGDLGAAKIVTRVSADELEVVTASGRKRFLRQPSCDETFGCRYGIAAMCWDLDPD